MPYIPPRRVTSTQTAITVTSNALPSWIPVPGYFNNVYRSDNGTVHYATSIDPDVYMADGVTPQVYQPRVFSDSYPAFHGVWNSQCGGAYNAELGTLGSILLFGGGHSTWNGCGVVRFDIATGVWSNYTYPIYASVDRSVTGGTVAELTGTVVSRGGIEDNNTRVSENGNYFKTMDDVQIPGGGDALGNGITVWNPYPIHSNCGICALPSDAGGGPLGSLIVNGHDQTGIRVVQAKWQVFRFDCATKVWSAVTIGDLISSEHSFPALEYDSTRKLMWYFTPSGRPIALDFKQSPVARHRPTGPSINFTGGYVANACYMPSRDIMVYLLASTVGAPTNDAWYRYPRIFAYRLTGYTFGGAFNPTPFEVQCNPSASSYLTNISQGLPTGWPGYRVATAETNWMGATDNGNLMQGGPWGPATPANPSKVRGINDRLEYCSEEDCLLFVERHGGVEDGTARADQTQIKLWKLRPPAIGQESSGTWTWEVEVINQTIGSGGAGINKLNEMPAWGGKSKYAPALKCMYYTDRPNMPVQVIRSADWT